MGAGAVVQCCRAWGALPAFDALVSEALECEYAPACGSTFQTTCSPEWHLTPLPYPPAPLPHPWQVYPLEDAAQAHTDLEGRGTTGKLLLSV